MSSLQPLSRDAIAQEPTPQSLKMELAQQSYQLALSLSPGIALKEYIRLSMDPDLSTVLQAPVPVGGSTHNLAKKVNLSESASRVIEIFFF